MISRNN